MSYQVIARKYRPRRFSEVVGQEHVTQTLANAIEQNRIAHAYLFVGPRGTGKTTIARIFAKCLNCTGGPAVDFPDEDPKCREITEGRSLDVLEIDGASNRGIEEIRELRDTVKYAPAGSKYKIYIIDEVHMLTKEAFNALLKTLEEPPEHVKFMFATTEPEKVLPTILSRCQRFDLRRIPASLIVKHLAEIAAKENVAIDEAALYAIARGAEGGMRDAESTLDQLISFCGNNIQESDVLSMFGLAARAQLLSLAGAILDGTAGQALRDLNDLARNGKDLSRLLSDLLAHFRNLMIFQYSKGDLSLLEVSESEANVLKEQAGAIAPESITRVMEVLSEAEGRLRAAASKKIFLEITLLRAIEARNAVSIDSVLGKLRQLREDGGSGAAPGPAPSRSPEAARPVRVETAPAATQAIMRETATPKVEATSEPAPVPERAKTGVAKLPAGPSGNSATIQPSESAASFAEPAATGTLLETAPAPESSKGSDLEALWSRMIEAISTVSPFMKAYLLESHPVSLNRNQFTLGFPPEYKHHLGLVDNPKNRAVLESKLGELWHADVSIRFVQAEAPANRVRNIPDAPEPEPATTISPAAPTVTPSANAAQAQAGRPNPSAAAPVFSKEDFKNDPLIKKAIEIFKGTIVEVRA